MGCWGWGSGPKEPSEIPQPHLLTIQRMCGSSERGGSLQVHQLENGRAVLLSLDRVLSYCTWICQKASSISFSPLLSGIWPFLFGIYCSGSISADELGSVVDFASKSHWPWALPQEFWPLALCAPLAICLDSWLAVLLVWLLLPGDLSKAMTS